MEGVYMIPEMSSLSLTIVVDGGRSIGSPLGTVRFCPLLGSVFCPPLPMLRDSAYAAEIGRRSHMHPMPPDAASTHAHRPVSPSSGVAGAAVGGLLWRDVLLPGYDLAFCGFHTQASQASVMITETSSSAGVRKGFSMLQWATHGGLRLCGAAMDVAALPN